MNETVNKYLLVRAKFMTEMHLRQPGFTYSACRLLTIIQGRIEKFKRTGKSRYIYQKPTCNTI